jgi:hypothetical protein
MYSSGQRKASQSKNGRHGNARDGALTPQQTIPAKMPEAAKASLGIVVNDIDGTANSALTNVSMSNDIITFDRQPVIGGGGSKMLLGTVLGGNSPDTSLVLGTLTRNGVTALPVPLYTGDLVQLVPTVEVDDWSKYDVPETYKAGDPLPLLPRGLCYIQLERLSNFGQSSWASAYHTLITPVDEGPVILAAAEVDAKSKAVITLIFNRDISSFNSVPRAISVFDKTSNYYPPVSWVSIGGDNSVSVFLKDDTVDLDHEYQISFGAGIFEAYGQRPHATNPAVDKFAVTFKGAKYAVCIGINRMALQTYFAGDLVLMEDTGFAIGDKATPSTIKSVVDIVSNATSVRAPHSHAFARFDAGASTAGAAVTKV